MLEIPLVIILIILLIILFSRIKISLTFTKNDKTFKGQIKIIIIEKIKIYTYNFTSQHNIDNETNENTSYIRKIYILKPCKEDLINYLKYLIAMYYYIVFRYILHQMEFLSFRQKIIFFLLIDEIIKND